MYKDREWVSGTEVEVFDFQKNRLGSGKLLNAYIPADSDFGLEIEMEGGDVVFGSDYIWIPRQVKSQEELGLQDYTIDVTVQNYNMVLEVSVLAKDSNDAMAKACAVEPRYVDEDPYLLLVEIDEDSSVFCTYSNINEAVKHIRTIKSGRWHLVKRDNEEGVVIKSWDDGN